LLWSRAGPVPRTLSRTPFRGQLAVLWFIKPDPHERDRFLLTPFLSDQLKKERLLSPIGEERAPFFGEPPPEKLIDHPLSLPEVWVFMAGSFLL